MVSTDQVTVRPEIAVLSAPNEELGTGHRNLLASLLAGRHNQIHFHRLSTPGTD